MGYSSLQVLSKQHKEAGSKKTLNDCNKSVEEKIVGCSLQQFSQEIVGTSMCLFSVPLDLATEEVPPPIFLCKKKAFLEHCTGLHRPHLMEQQLLAQQCEYEKKGKELEPISPFVGGFWVGKSAQARSLLELQENTVSDS